MNATSVIGMCVGAFVVYKILNQETRQVPLPHTTVFFADDQMNYTSENFGLRRVGPISTDPKDKHVDRHFANSAYFETAHI